MGILLQKFIKCDLIYGIPGLKHNDNEKFFNYADDFLKKKDINDDDDFIIFIKQ